MAAHQQPRIEELSDSDPSDMDIDDYIPTATSKAASTAFNPNLMNPASISVAQPSPFRTPASGAGPSTQQLKTWACLYPVYFDITRTRSQGRRVDKTLAVTNPLAWGIADALASLGFQPKLELMSTHPKDWANTGRVRVQLKDSGTGKLSTAASGAGIKNKHHLFIEVAKHLKQHPTTDQTPLKLPHVPGEQREAKPPPSVPRGWKMNSILPLHSPAVKGHGVTDNPLKEAMAQLGDSAGMGAENGGASSGGGGADAGKAKKKKEKEKKKG